MPKREDDIPITNENVTMFVQNSKFIVMTVNNDHIIEARELLNLLLKNRAENRNRWYEVGQCLHNIDVVLLKDWIEFSKKGSRFTKENCESQWKKMSLTSYGLATLYYFAMTDNPARFLKMKESKVDELMISGMEATHYAVAKYLIEKFKYIYKCASIKHNLWYEFKNHKWVEIDSAYTLRNLISNVLVAEYSKKQQYLYELSKQKQGYDKEMCINEAMFITRVVTKLNSSPFKTGVIKECAGLLYDPNFLSNLDENTNLICFEDGVYDLEKNIFRAGLPDDCITLTTGYKFVRCDKNNDIFINIKNFFRKIQPNKIMRKYLIMLLATFLRGNTIDDTLHILINDDDNNCYLSTLMTLMEYALGDLCKSIDVMNLSGKLPVTPSNIPWLVDKKGVRMCIFNDNTTSSDIDITSMIKFLLNSDVSIKAPFTELIYFRPQFRPILPCHVLPTIMTNDEDTWDKINVVPLNHSIDDNNNNNNNNNTGLIKNFVATKGMFMALLIRYYQKYLVDDLYVPKAVKRCTVGYRKSCDIYHDFITDCLVKTTNKTHKIDVLKLHGIFKKWWDNKYSGKCPPVKKLRLYLSRAAPTYNADKDALMRYKIKPEELSE